MMVLSPLGPNEFIDMDASGKYGLGAINYLTKEFFLLPTPEIIAHLPIHVGEMAVLMLVLDVWSGPVRSQLDQPETSFCSKHLSLFSDNQSVIAAINFGRSKDDFLSLGTRYVHHQMAIRDSTLTQIDFL